MKNHKYPLVSIVIPAFRSELFITRLIQNVSKIRYPNFEVIMVFDPSKDLGVKIARRMVKNWKNWKVIENKKQLGLSNSLNLGIEKAKGNLIGFIVTDMAVDPNWLRELVKFLQNSDPSVGVAIGKIYDYHHRDRIQVYRMYLMPQTGYTYIPEYGFKDSRKFQKPFVGYSGAEGLIIKREVFEKAGLFDKDIINLIHDLDMMWRVWLAGYKIVRVPEAKVYHWSLKEGRATAKWEFMYSQMVSIFIQNYSLKYLLKYLPQLLIIYTFRALILLLQGNSDPIKGWLNGLGWSIANLPKTLRKRKHIQTKVRVVSDEYLEKTIFADISILTFYRYLRGLQKNITPVMLTQEGKNEKILTYSK